MKYRVTLSQLAKNDLRGIYEFIAADSPIAAIAYTRRIRTSCSKLADMPMRGRMREDVGPDIRSISFEGRATIFFRILDARVRVLRILYAGREYPKSWPDV